MPPTGNSASAQRLVASPDLTRNRPCRSRSRPSSCKKHSLIPTKKPTPWRSGWTSFATPAGRLRTLPHSLRASSRPRCQVGGPFKRTYETPSAALRSALPAGPKPGAWLSKVHLRAANGLTETVTGSVTRLVPAGLAHPCLPSQWPRQPGMKFALVRADNPHVVLAGQHNNVMPEWRH
jgi:hypothetical protein